MHWLKESIALNKSLETRVKALEEKRKTNHCAGCGQASCIKTNECAIYFFDELIREVEHQRQLGNRAFAEAVVKALGL
ncbi:MAG: hypothetical protein EBW14_14690 [Oxalobacteraceae bacterium]|nr:hypothetical protein [Oxalobacteraceae bacterium]